VHAATRDEETFRTEGTYAAFKNLTVVAAHIPGDGRAQIRVACLRGVKRLTLSERLRDGISDESGCRNVTFPDIKRDETLSGTSELEDLDNAA
jgi:hypothetical protein